MFNLIRSQEEAGPGWEQVEGGNLIRQTADWLCDLRKKLYFQGLSFLICKMGALQLLLHRATESVPREPDSSHSSPCRQEPQGSQLTQRCQRRRTIPSASPSGLVISHGSPAAPGGCPRLAEGEAKVQRWGNLPGRHAAQKCCFSTIPSSPPLHRLSVQAPPSPTGKTTRTPSGNMSI